MVASQPRARFTGGSPGQSTLNRPAGLLRSPHAAVAGTLLFAGSLILYVATRSPWLDDWDSFNFARAIGQFDVRLNQPQPPGYPAYVFLARLLNLGLHDPLLSLTLLSAVSGAICLLAFYAIGHELGTPWAALPLALMPLFWLSAGMALSDTPGLALATVAVWLLLEATSRRSWQVAALGGLAAGVAAGVRPQDAILPIAVLALYVAPRLRQLRPIAATLGAFGITFAAWAVPLVLNLGGIGSAWSTMVSQGSYVGSTDSLLARPFTAANLAQRLSDFGSVFGAYLGAPANAGWLPLAGVGAAVVLLSVAARSARLVHLALTWLLPYFALMLLVLRPDDPRKILPAIPPLLLLLGGVRGPRAVGAILCAAVAAFFAFRAVPLVLTLDTQPPSPYQAAVYVAAHESVEETVVVAGASFNALRYLQPGYRAYLLDDLDQAALEKDLATAKRLVLLDKEGFTPRPSWIATDTKTFQRDPLVLPKGAEVWLQAYEPLPASPAELELPPGNAIHIGTPDDIRYLLDGWDRPESIAGQAARWSGREADVRFAVDRAADATLTLVGVAYPSSQQLTVLLNGATMANLAMSRDWAPYQVFLPASAFQAGAVNTITLQHSTTTSAFRATAGESLDQRALAAAYSLLQLAWR